MNILYLNNSVHMGGDTKCILKLCKELKNKHNISMCSEGGILLSEFEKLGVKHFNIGDVEDKNPINILKNIIKLRRIIIRNNIDIVHSHHRMTSLISKLATVNTDTKVVHTQHLCIDDKFKLTKIALKNIPIITVSNAAKEILKVKSNLNEKKINTIYNTIEVESDNNEIDSILLNLKNSGHFIVAQVSRIIDYKGIYDFVDIAEETLKKNKNIRFVFIGDGPEKDELNNYINKKKLESYVFLIGNKNNVINHLKYVDVLLLCSYIEGLPLAPIEAFSQGIPVIATNIDGTNEEILNGYNGYLVEKSDVKQFTKNIELLFCNKDLYRDISSNCKTIYSKQFSPNKYIESHEEIYTKTIKEII